VPPGGLTETGATGKKALHRPAPPLSFRAIMAPSEAAIRTANLKSGMPLVHEALQRFDRELALARQQDVPLLKLIHGYGSSGAGGEIRIAVQKRLLELAQDGQIRGCIFGEHWSRSDDLAWKLLQSHPELKHDPDLGRSNRGITIVLL